MKRFLALAALALLLPFTAFAQDTTPLAPEPVPELTETHDTASDVKMVQDYLNNLKSARARFVQTASDGSQLTGTFYLQRPGRLRFEYDPPVKDFVVADGTFIYFYDAQLGEQSNAPIGQTLADFFLRDDLELKGDIQVDNVKRGGDFLQVQLSQKDDPEGGSLTLGFKENPLTLKKWRVVDGQGKTTEVELFYLKTDVANPSELFAYKDPKKKGMNN